MTDYNDGKWHEWNGGECPVHPKSVVQLVRGDEINADVVTWRAEECQGICWTHSGASHPIIAFRVVKEYGEPREAWAVGDHLRSTEDAAWKFINDLIANNPNCGFEKWTPRRMREVLE